MRPRQERFRPAAENNENCNTATTVHVRRCSQYEHSDRAALSSAAWHATSGGGPPHLSVPIPPTSRAAHAHPSAQGRRLAARRRAARDPHYPFLLFAKNSIWVAILCRNVVAPPAHSVDWTLRKSTCCSNQRLGPTSTCADAAAAFRQCHSPGAARRHQPPAGRGAGGNASRRAISSATSTKKAFPASSRMSRSCVAFSIARPMPLQDFGVKVLGLQDSMACRLLPRPAAAGVGGAEGKAAAAGWEHSPALDERILGLGAIEAVDQFACGVREGRRKASDKRRYATRGGWRRGGRGGCGARHRRR